MQPSLAWKAFCNEIYFPLRHRFVRSLRRKPYAESGGSLISQPYLPHTTSQQLNPGTLRDGLFYRWLLDKAGPYLQELRQLDKPLNVIDIGSKNFFYAPFLADWLTRLSERFELKGLELDPHRLYRDFYTREDYAKYFVKVATELLNEKQTIDFEGDNWLSHPASRYDLTFCFFPFVSPGLHLSWGLPRSTFDPQSFYKKILAESEFIIFTHQGFEEFRTSRMMIEHIKSHEIIFEDRIDKNPYTQRKVPVYLIVLKRSGI